MVIESVSITPTTCEAVFVFEAKVGLSSTAYIEENIVLFEGM